MLEKERGWEGGNFIVTIGGWRESTGERVMEEAALAGTTGGKLYRRDNTAVACSVCTVSTKGWSQLVLGPALCNQGCTGAAVRACLICWLL